MIEEIRFHITEAQGEFYATAKGNPAFALVESTRQRAIDAGISAWVQWLRQTKRVAPKGTPVVVKTEPYVDLIKPKRVQKFGGAPVRKLTPKETLTVQVEV